MCVIPLPKRVPAARTAHRSRERRGRRGRRTPTARRQGSLPLSGGFSPARRDVCELVPAAQETAIGALRPGARFRDFHRETMRVIAERLHAWGIAPVPAKEALADDSGPWMARPLDGQPTAQTFER